MIENISKQLNEYFKNSPHEAINFRDIFASELFGLALKQVSFPLNMCILIIFFFL